MPAPNFKPVHIKDAAYRKSMRDAVCIVCGNPEAVGAHIRTGEFSGVGRKPSDDLILPLCNSCHMRQESQPGPWWWEKRLSSTIDEIKDFARQRYADWKNPSVSPEPNTGSDTPND